VFLRSLDDDHFPDSVTSALLVTAACLAWTVVAVAVTAVIGSRRIDRVPSAARAR
jgi:hypothetical protein